MSSRKEFYRSMRSKSRVLLVLLTIALLCTACGGGEPAPQEDGAAQQVSGESSPPETPPFDPVVPAAEAVDPQWFSDVAFVGDSVSVMLENYSTNTGVLGTPAFFCSVSLSQTNALSYEAGNSHLPEYPKGSGQHPKVEDGIAAAGAKKVYVMLGMNCISGGIDRASQDLVKLVDRILEKSPDAAILVQSVTPMTADSPRADEALNNTTIQAFNETMKEICQEREWYYVNVAEAVADEQGYLRADYSGDRPMGIHFNYNGAEVWANYLLTHVPQALK